MNVEFSKAFVKASKRLSGKMLDSLRRTIVEVKAAKGIQDISDCKKLVGYRNIYRIRLGDYRALFTLEIEFSGDTIFFQLIGGIKIRLKISIFYGEKVVHLADF